MVTYPPEVVQALASGQGGGGVERKTNMTSNPPAHILSIMDHRGFNICSKPVINLFNYC